MRSGYVNLVVETAPRLKLRLAERAPPSWVLESKTLQSAMADVALLAVTLVTRAV